MNYTFKIKDVSNQASGLIKMLLALSEDYDFLEVIPENDNLSKEHKKELLNRYEEFKKNPEEGKSWEQLKKEIDAVYTIC